MLKTKTVFVAAALSAMLMTATADAAGSQGPSCGWLQQMSQNTIKTQSTLAKTLANQGIPVPQNTNLSKCLGNINNIGGSFSMGVPTNLFGSLENQLCSMSASTINGALDKYTTQRVNIGNYANASAGANNNGNLQYSINDNSSQVANSIWNSIQ